MWRNGRREETIGKTKGFSKNLWQLAGNIIRNLRLWGKVKKNVIIFTYIKTENTSKRNDTIIISVYFYVRYQLTTVVRHVRQKKSSVDYKRSKSWKKNLRRKEKIQKRHLKHGNRKRLTLKKNKKVVFNILLEKQEFYITIFLRILDTWIRFTWSIKC